MTPPEGTPHRSAGGARRLRHSADRAVAAATSRHIFPSAARDPGQLIRGNASRAPRSVAATPSRLMESSTWISIALHP